MIQLFTIPNEAYVPCDHGSPDYPASAPPDEPRGPALGAIARRPVPSDRANMGRRPAGRKPPIVPVHLFDARPFKG